jgi:hypothetical protein
MALERVHPIVPLFGSVVWFGTSHFACLEQLFLRSDPNVLSRWAYGHAHHMACPRTTALRLTDRDYPMYVGWVSHRLSVLIVHIFVVISDIGADILKPLFIVVCVITAVSFVLALVLERWLRHSGRLAPNMRTREKVFAALAIFGATLGGAGLILLSIFDTKRHMMLHRVFLVRCRSLDFTTAPDHLDNPHIAHIHARSHHFRNIHGPRSASRSIGII